MRGRTKWIGLGAVVVVLGLAVEGAWRYEEHVHRLPIGVTLLPKVTGHGVARGFDHVVLRQGDVPICFRVRMGPKKESRDDDIDCPAGAPLPVAKDPSVRLRRRSRRCAGGRDTLAAVAHRLAPGELGCSGALR